MKALVTGINGFVGRHLCRHLLSQGDTVTGTIVEGSFDEPGVRVLPLDILDADAVRAAIDEVRPDAVYHLAGFSSVKLSWERPTLAFDVNVKGTLHLLDALRAHPQTRVLLIGTAEQYGLVRQEDCPVREALPTAPQNPYAISKDAAERLGVLYHRAHGVNAVMVRAFNHIGPEQEPQFVVADFCRQAAEIEAGRRDPLLRVGNLEASRDFTDVRDIVRAYRLLMERGQTGEVYNVGSGQVRSIRAVLDEILAQTAVPVAVETDPAKLRPLDMPLLQADAGKLHSATGWTPEIPLSQTIADTLSYWRAAR